LLAACAGGIRGVAPAARVLSVKVISENGTGDTFTFARGIVEAVDRGARVVNVSMGTRADDFLLRQAVEYALSKDVLIVAAAGNDGVDGLLYPARYPGVLAVSGVDASGRHLYFSNRGNEVALAAPGLGVAAAGADGDLVLFSGTSPAAPFVSGAAAWLLSEDATLTASRIRDVLAACADDTGEPGADPETGAGVLNFRRLQERNTRGVRDIALSGPFARSAPDGSGDAILTIFAENRGTEDLRRVEMKIEGNGVSESRTFYNVRVSETVSCAVRLSASALAAQGGVRVTSVVTTPGVADAYPQDNGPRTTVLSRASTRADLDVR
jgi:subtilisin family serine protease